VRECAAEDANIAKVVIELPRLDPECVHPFDMEDREDRDSQCYVLACLIGSSIDAAAVELGVGALLLNRRYEVFAWVSARDVPAALDRLLQHRVSTWPQYSVTTSEGVLHLDCSWYERGSPRLRGYVIKTAAGGDDVWWVGEAEAERLGHGWSRDSSAAKLFDSLEAAHDEAWRKFNVTRGDPHVRVLAVRQREEVVLDAQV
jgi:hypothetical protein